MTHTLVPPVLEGLKQTGLVRVPYPDKLQRVVMSGLNVWQLFCKLPEDNRLKIPYNHGVGYELKKTPGATLDLKEDFHYTAQASAWLNDRARASGDPIITLLLFEAQELLTMINPLIDNFARQLEENFSLPGLAEEVVESRDKRIIRYLHYFGGREVGDEIATSHADKSGFTLHLHESAPGLQYLNHNGEWIDMPISPTETAIIPGMQLQYRSKNELQATCHRVVATPETAKTGRWSMVCFIPLGKTPSYNKQGAGRLQEFAPGFNYTMTFDEFSKLFV